MSSHLLKCLSTNHLSPCASELYKCLVQLQRRELCEGSEESSSLTETDLSTHWARRWQPFLHQALTSDVTLLLNSSSSHLLPCTFQVFPSAVDLLLADLDPQEPGHLQAWACVLSSYRAVTGRSPWSLQGGSTLETLRLALGSADDKVRLAALSVLCCSPKTRDAPTAEEMTTLREFIPQNLNCESSSFRQHLQAGVRKLLVRVRDGCLALLRGAKGKKKTDSVHERTQDILEQIGEENTELQVGVHKRTSSHFLFLVFIYVEFVEWLGQLPYSYLAPGHSYQRKKTVLLLLSALLETCTDTWSPDRKKGQPPGERKTSRGVEKERTNSDVVES